MFPHIHQVLELSKHYNVIPLSCTIVADTETPIRLFQRLQHEKYAFLLESVEGGTQWARYSFIGTDPFLLFKGKNGVNVVVEQGRQHCMEDKPLEALQSLLQQYRSPIIPGLPPLTGGAIGFFGYDLMQQYEARLPRHTKDDLNMNDIQFMFCDQLIAFDHVKQQMQVMVNLHVPEHAEATQITQLYEETKIKLERLICLLSAPLTNALRSMPHEEFTTQQSTASRSLRSNETKQSFMDKVERAKAYIRTGDVFQVVLSQRFEQTTEAEPLDVYRMLRITNPSPYMYMLKMGDETLVGSSPEALVRVKEDRVETRPIAGTRPRGNTVECDNALEQELLADEKERAEHIMLVDLGRNDIGRVCEYGSVQCDSYMNVERYSHVMHIVSNVSGQLRADKNFFDAFISCLPAGTVSGAPKIRAMEIIAELEHEARGAYAGAIGYLGFNGNLDTCITIRTIIFKHGKAYVQAGAGIVWDSIAEKEYEETVNKAKGMLVAIERAELIFSQQLHKQTVDSSTASPPTTGCSQVNWDYYLQVEPGSEMERGIQ
ncbi:anthranilate synthase component I [Paenibacillus sp. UMB4589-SE434]|uniref:anthranilate synthase component I n=1 Tax=Paenibacillus sp. UMB4589-SE434 TaxID=3046314 RepID=UPI00254B775B|nr:anthranilate synthase component I [Paenibacillus sp. UMB4589-SE434]MDK8179490.1 anthranilate synthase component I [Paenibacillus sp. UMB4589-SE434]